MLSLRSFVAPLVSLVFVSAAWAGPVIVGFDASRAASFSLESGSLLTQLRSAIASSFPGATYRSVSTLSDASLAGADLVFIGSPSGTLSVITPLTVNEQNALLNFVNGGGGAILFTDNDSFAGSNSQPANLSLLAPFGVTCTGTGPAWESGATPPFPSFTPISNGPFGEVDHYSVGWSGWFDTTSSAIVVATLDANQRPSLVVYPPGVLTTTAGAVVAFSDSTMVADSFLTAPNRTLVLNAIAYAQRPPVTCDPDFNQDGNADQDDVLYLLNVIAGGDNPSGADPDFNHDGNADSGDLSALVDVLAGGNCP